MRTDYSRVENLYLAGGFGNYIRVESAVTIGLLPSELRDRIRPVGNAAGAGARRMTLSADEEARSMDLSGKMRYVELSARADFQDRFVERMFFQETEA